MKNPPPMTNERDAGWALAPGSAGTGVGRAARRAWLLAAGGSALLYLATMAPGLVWQDSGEAQVRAAVDDWRGPYELSRSHVLYFMCVSALRHAAGVDPARAANLVAVVCGALTIGNVSAVLTLLLRRRVATLAGAALLAVSHTFWQFSTMAETYTLTAALLSGELLCLVCFARSGRPVALVLLALLNGLGWSNHNLALLSLFCYSLVAAFTLRRWIGRAWRIVPPIAAAWLAGIAPLIWLLVREWQWGSESLVAIQSLLVGQHGEQIFNLRIGAGLLLRISGMIVLSFPTPLLLLLPLGVRPMAQRLPRWLFAALCLLLGVHFVFAARYNIADQYTFFIPTYVLMTVFVGAGIEWLLDRAAAPDRMRLAAAVWLAALLPIGVYAALPAVARRLPESWMPFPTRDFPYRDPYAWFLQPWHCGDDGPRRFAEEVFDVAPPDALILTDHSLRGPLLYLQNHDGRRRDVRIGHGDLWQPWLKPKRHTREEYDELVRQGRLLAPTTDPRYMRYTKWMLEEYDFVPLGPLYQVRPRGGEAIPQRTGRSIRPLNAEHQQGGAKTDRAATVHRAPRATGRQQESARPNA